MIQLRREWGRFYSPSSLCGVGGAKPRLLLAWVSTEAVRTQSRELVLGKSLSEFMRTLGIYNSGCLLLILAAIIYWQIREIDRVLSEAGSDADDLNFELLSHISPIGWDNVLLYGEYQLNRSLVRSERLSV